MGGAVVVMAEDAEGRFPALDVVRRQSPGSLAGGRVSPLGSVLYGIGRWPVWQSSRRPVATQTKSKLTGERPQQGVTPYSLLALHAAGYRAVMERLKAGRLLDVGCGQGFESVGFVSPGRSVVGVDYSAEATETAVARFGSAGLGVARMDA